jgi:hypothetical protein
MCKFGDNGVIVLSALCPHCALIMHFTDQRGSTKTRWSMISGGASIVLEAKTGSAVWTTAMSSSIVSELPIFLSSIASHIDMLMF